MNVFTHRDGPRNALGAAPPSQKLTTDMRTARIAILLPRLNINGVNRINLRLGAHFMRYGLEVDIVTRDPNGPMAAQIAFGMHVHPIGVHGRLFFFPSLLRYLRRRAPTHVISPYDDVSMMTLVACTAIRLNPFTVFASHNSIIGSHQARPLYRQLINGVTERFVRHGYACASAIVAVSEGLATELVESFGVPRSRIFVIHNPVIADDFARMAQEITSCAAVFERFDTVIGFFGRLERQKNIVGLLKAFALLRNRSRCHLLIVGDGSMRDDAVAQAEILGIMEHVTFQPFVANPLPVMRQCALVVVPSIYEGFPTVLVEAMACGTQVVATNCNYGPAEILQQGKLGQLVPIGDNHALADAMQRSLTGEVHIPDTALVDAGMSYSTDKAVRAYLRVMHLEDRVRT